jgi:hypothetical protein
VSFSMPASGSNCTDSSGQNCGDAYRAQYMVKSERVLYALTRVSATTAAIARKATLGSSKFLAKPLRCITGSPECLSSFEMMAAISCEGG